MIRPKRANILLSKVGKIQKFVRWDPPYKRLQNQATFGSSIFVGFQQITFKISNFTNLKAFFSGGDGFFLTCPCHKMKKKKKKKKNNPWKGLLLSLWWDMIPTEWSELTEVRKKNSGECGELNVANPGKGPEDPLPRFIFRPNNWGLTGSLAPLSQGLDDRRLAPHPLHFPLSEGLDLPLKSKCRSSALSKVTESFL